MRIRKVFATILFLIFIFSFTACEVKEKNKSDSSLDNTKTLDSKAEKDLCPCCPKCKENECECFECGVKDECECTLPGGLSLPRAYDLGIKTEWRDSDAACPYPTECGGISSGSVKITLNWDDSKNGYFGINQDGYGEYISYKSHYWDSMGHVMLGNASPGTKYNFVSMLYIPNVGKDNVVKVGLNFLSEDDVTMNWPNGEVLPFPGMMGMIQGWFTGKVTMSGIEFDVSDLLDSTTYEFDQNTGMFILELPLTDGNMQKTFSWDNMKFTITITLTPAE